MVCETIFRHHAGFAPQVTARLRRSVPSWRKKMGHKLSASAEKRLRAMGYLPANRKLTGAKR